jgi:RNA polymerase sigma factor (sigma-70 family)
MDSRTDEEIIRLILNGHTDAYRSLVERHQQMVYRVAFSVTRNHEDAEEVTQDAFLKAFTSLSGFQGRSRFTTWLFRIVYHRALNHLESSGSYRKYVELDESISAGHHMADDGFRSLNEKDQIKYIGKALDQLNAGDRMALSLYYLEDMPQQEISGITGWSLASTKQRVHRARAKLHQALNAILKTEKKNLL